MIDQVIGQFGPGSPTDEQVQEDNPHGRGWHVIKGGEWEPSDDPQSSYQLFGARHFLNYESTSGTCGNTWKDGTKLYDYDRVCSEPDMDFDDKWEPIPNSSKPHTHTEWCQPRYCPHGENHKYRADYCYFVAEYAGANKNPPPDNSYRVETGWTLGAN